MDMTSKIATTALLVALVATGCGGGGPSEAEIETACWAEREAIFVEMDTVEGMSSSAFTKIYGMTNRGRIVSELHETLPDC